LIQKWNWKSAILSTILRSVLFFLANLTAGLPAAFATEWIYRGITAGFYGAVTQVFCDVELAWSGALTVLVLLPIANHRSTDARQESMRSPQPVHEELHGMVQQRSSARAVKLRAAPSTQVP
jgi:hypothetical protein